MGKKQLVREAKRAALTRMEDAARSPDDFKAVTKQWDHLDDNRERRERDHEVKRNEEIIRLDYSDGLIFPIPFLHQAWRGAINGDFLDVIYDNAGEMWQLVEDGIVSSEIKTLTDRQKDVIFLSAVRFCTPQQVACYRDKTDRAVRKLLTAALDNIRDKLAPIIREQIQAGAPEMTLAKRQFLEWYDEENRQEKIALDNVKGE